MLRRSCRRRGLGLLVTSHRGVGLPDLHATAVDAELAWRVVEQLQNGYSSPVAPADVAQRLSQHGGNLREALFDLYDLYARRRNA
jgi:hypothetical protein